jgi:hypothetical protein
MLGIRTIYFLKIHFDRKYDGKKYVLSKKLLLINIFF